jgi:hypothetical protein
VHACLSLCLTLAAIDCCLQSEEIAQWEDLNVFNSAGDPTSDDLKLALVLWSIRWSGSLGWQAAHRQGTLNDEHRLIVTLDLAKDNADPTNQKYRLQLLFNEKCCSRGFDIIVGEETGAALGGGGGRQGTMIVQGFSPERTQGGIHPGGAGNHEPASAAVVTYDFTYAGISNQLTIELNGEDASDCTALGVNGGSQVQDCGFPDNNPTLMGLTLELCNGGANHDSCDCHGQTNQDC